MNDIEKKYFVFFREAILKGHRPPRWDDVPDYVKEFARFVETTMRLDHASRGGG